MKSPWKKWLAAIVILAALAVAAFWVSCVEPCRFPTNQQVLARWQRDRQTIFALRNFLQQQPEIAEVLRGEVRYGDSLMFVSPQRPGLNPEAFANIRKKMTACHVVRMGKYDDDTYFAFAGCGFAGSGWRLAFVYRTDSPRNLLKNLDEVWSHRGSERTAYVELEKNWYIRVRW